MTKEDFLQTRPGLYKIHWKEDPGRSSVAAIGVDAKGGRWLAPTNWVSPISMEHGNFFKHIDAIDHIEAINP